VLLLLVVVPFGDDVDNIGISLTENLL